MKNLRIESENNNESIMKWFEEEVGDGENSILAYPDLQSTRQIYAKYVKDQLSKEEGVNYSSNNSNNNRQTKYSVT